MGPYCHRLECCHIPYSGPRPMIFPRLPDAHPDLLSLIHTSILLVHASRPLVHYRFGSVHYRTSIYPYLRTSAAKPASSTFGPVGSELIPSRTLPRLRYRTISLTHI